ncbi:MAG: response regulator [Anaerolineae bacterium]|jgi:pilus assembly protein CpaE|nr:response regulator [Anaerolineae bacterium]MDH7473537.1 response regulator [Anaerolineae bacterium]
MSEEKIRVLIVDDIPETRENLKKLLYFETDVEVVGAATSGEEGIELAKQYQPHIVLMDINMPGMDGITASEAITQEVPFAQIIMMSVQSEADYLRRSMLAGARDFLTKPFTSDELISTIRRVYEMAASRRAAMPMPQVAGPRVEVAPGGLPPKAGRIITVFSPKGGVGCSMIAVNLALAMQKLTEPDGKVVLVDASLQFGDVGVMLNLQATRSIADLASQIEELDSYLIETVLLPHPSQMKALLAPPRPEMADLLTPTHMKSVLEELRHNFDYVIVDTWTALHDLVLQVLDISDRIVLVTVPDVPSIKNTRLFFDVTEALEYPPNKLVLVVNQADRRSGGISVKLIEENLKHRVAAQIPFDDRTALVSINQGVPFVLGDRRNPLSQAIFKLGEVLIKDLEQEEAVAQAEVKETQTRARLGRLFR